MNNKGFTLIELLLGIALVSIIGTVALSILFITFRASKKSDALIDLKQSGNTVLSQITRQIRYAKSLDDPSDSVNCPVSSPPTLTSITITSSADNAQTVFSCIPATPGPATIASNGASLIDISSDISSVVVTNCSITCTQSAPNDPPTIGISFTLSKPGSSLPEAGGSASFQSSVTMRNFSRR